MMEERVEFGVKKKFRVLSLEKESWVGLEFRDSMLFLIK